MTDGGNVVNLFEPDISVGEVLTAAADKGLESVLVLGEMAKVFAILGDDDE
jgi:hypothetical protein